MFTIRFNEFISKLYANSSCSSQGEFVTEILSALCGEKNPIENNKEKESNFFPPNFLTGESSKKNLFNKANKSFSKELKEYIKKRQNLDTKKTFISYIKSDRFKDTFPNLYKDFMIFNTIIDESNVAEKIYEQFMKFINNIRSNEVDDIICEIDLLITANNNLKEENKLLQGKLQVQTEQANSLKEENKSIQEQNSALQDKLNKFDEKGIFKRILHETHIIAFALCLFLFIGFNVAWGGFTLILVALAIFKICRGDISNLFNTLLLKPHWGVIFALWLGLGLARIGISWIWEHNYPFNFGINVIICIPFLISSLYGYIRNLKKNKIVEKTFNEYKDIFNDINLFLAQFSVLVSISLRNFNISNDYFHVLFDAINIYVGINAIFLILIILKNVPKEQSMKSFDLYPWNVNSALAVFLISSCLTVFYYADIKARELYLIVKEPRSLDTELWVVYCLLIVFFIAVLAFVLIYFHISKKQIEPNNDNEKEHSISLFERIRKISKISFSVLAQLFVIGFLFPLIEFNRNLSNGENSPNQGNLIVGLFSIVLIGAIVIIIAWNAKYYKSDKADKNIQE